MKRNTILNRSFYDNVIILDIDDTPLSTVSNRKAAWYIRKNLGTEATPPMGYPRAIKLNFKADMNRPQYMHDLVVCKDQCVFCGVTKELTLHHVVPHVIRQHFPYEHKARGRNWCVLLCFKHHMAIEEDLKKIYYNDDFPHDSRAQSTNMTLQKIKATGNMYRIPPEKIDNLLAGSDYKSVDEIPTLTSEGVRDHRWKMSLAHKERIRLWALKFIEDHGGIEGTKQFFREHFMTYNPQFLPEGWLKEQEVA
jgi:hypothetical protein